MWLALLAVIPHRDTLRDRRLLAVRCSTLHRDLGDRRDRVKPAHGFTGQVSLGHILIGLGAYTAAYPAGGSRLRSSLAPGPASSARSEGVLLIGPFALRLKGLYLAM